MAKYQNDSMLDAAFDWVKARVTKVCVCSTQPTTYAEATSTYMLANTSYSSTDMTTANGDSSGRKVTYGAKSSISVTNSGTAAHIAWVGSTGSTLLVVTTCTTQALTSGNTVNIPAVDQEIADAA